jgi:hypothetical protein
MTFPALARRLFLILFLILVINIILFILILSRLLPSIILPCPPANVPPKASPLLSPPP